MMQDQLGKVIKSYEIADLVGTGGFGAVYRAYQAVVDREVAIKVIWPAFANHPNFIRRFEAEAQLVAGLEHPYIVPLYDYWRDPDGAYIVMRYLRGGALRDELDGRQWRIAQAARLLNQVASALSLAHRAGVVHRDIKPENILLDEDKNAYLADFGIAQIVSNAADGDPDHMGGMGSPAYAAPEQISGGLTSSQSDIYGLGVILFEMLTGTHPFPELEHLSVTEMNEMRARSKLPNIQSIRSDVPRAINDVIQRATALDPKDRYPDAMTFIRAFQDAAGSAAQSYNGMRIVEHDNTLPNPYRGLRAFQEADAPYFFGREALVQRLLNRLKEQTDYERFLVVVGPSGSGKSSVVRAGLIPRLRDDALPGSGRWYYNQVVPGHQPFSEIENAIISLSVQSPERLHDQLLQSDEGLLNAINAALPDDESEFFLFIDQFEELFTLVTDERQITHFLKSLYTAVTSPKSRMRVVVTIRADFYDRPLLQPRLSDMVRERTEVVVPLSPDEIERVIIEPARRVGVMIDHGLVAAIVAEVKEQPGALPLLQYALSELFERRTASFIAPEAYKALGGVRGALARRADDLYTALSADEQEATRQLFLRLITLGEGTEDTRRRALLSEVTSINGDDASESDVALMRRVVDQLGDARLLTFDRDPITRSPTVEVTHEAIIREWDRLRAWLDESRNDVRMQRTLSALAAEWDKNGRDPSFLLRGVRLDSYEKWTQTTTLALTTRENAYLRASVQERINRDLAERERQEREQRLEQRALNRTRWAATIFAIAFFAAIGLSAFAFFQSNRATLAAREAEEALQVSQSIAWEAGARRALGEDDGDLALMLALQAVEMDNPPPQAISTLAEVAFAPGTRRVISGHEAWVFDVAISPDRRTMASVSSDSTLKLWNIATGGLLHDLTGHSGDVESVAFSPDGRLVVSTATDFRALLWDVTTGEMLREFNTTPQPVRSAAFTPDGTRLLTVSSGGLVILWDVSSGQQLRSFAGHGVATVLAVAISPDGTSALTGARDGRLLLWNLESGSAIELVGHTTQINQVQYDAGGTRAISASGDGTIILWDLQTAQPVRSLIGSVDEVRDIELSPDGQRVYSASITGMIDVWDLETGLLLDSLNGHTEQVLGLGLSADGQLLVSGAKDTQIRVWNVGQPGAEIFLSGHDRRVTDVHTAANNSLYSVAVDGTLRQWDRTSGTLLHAVRFDEPLLSVTATDDGSRVMVGTRGGAVYQVDMALGTITQTLTGHTESVNALVFLPDGQRLLSASADQTIILWDVETGLLIRRYQGHESTVNALDISPDGTRFVSGGADEQVIVWDLLTAQMLQRLSAHEGSVYAVAYSPTGTLIASGARDDDLIFWNPETGAEISRLVGELDHIWSLDFSTNGERLAVSDDNGTIFVWDVVTNTEYERFDLGNTPVFNLAFTADDRNLVSGQSDGSLILWRMYDLETLLDWIADHRFVRGWRCVEREQYRLPADILCS